MLFNLFAQTQDAVPMMPLSYGIAILALLAFVLGASTLSAHRKLSWSASMTQGLGSLVWASPVIAVLAFVGMKVVPYFQFGTAGHVASESTIDPRQVEVVETFPEQTVPVSTADPTTTESLPEWTTKPVMLLASTQGQTDREVYRVVVESPWEKSEKAAKESLFEESARIVQEDFQRFYPGGSAFPTDAIARHALKAEALQVQSHQDVETPFKMYKVYAQVELSPKVREELSGTWKTEVALKRAELFAGLLGLFTLFAGAFAAYFHLDKKSNGNHRFRLKLAATALMTAGGLGLLAALTRAA